MKKLLVFALAVLLVAAFCTPAPALENKFGGYWRTRAWTAMNMTGEDETEAKDVMAVDTRTRLYYTAILNDNLKLVNKFEMDAVWGDSDVNTYADIGADGKHLEIKNSYADFKVGDFHGKVGVQGGAIARGFIFDDDFGGVNLAYEGEGFSFPFIWIKAYEGGPGKEANDYDVDYYAIAPSFAAGEMMTVNPFLVYATSSDASAWGATAPYKDMSVYYVGVDVSMKMDAFSAWFTGIYEGGSLDLVEPGNYGDTYYDSGDVSAFLAAVGGSFSMGFGDIHGQFVYASGDDDTENPDRDDFFVPKGQSYYWAEIMGYGKLGDVYYAAVSENAPADQIGNIMFANAGMTFKPVDDLTLTFDAWYAALAEAPEGVDDDLGVELDLVLTYKLVEGMNIDLIGAYLFAGDGTYNGDNDANPYELGTRLSLSF